MTDTGQDGWTSPGTLRLAAYVGVLSLFFLLARQGIAEPLLYTIFGLYLVVATLWVRGLDDTWVHDAPERTRPRVWLSVCAVPLVVTGVAFFTTDRSGASLALGLVLTAYVALGLAIRHLRWGVAGLVALPGPLRAVARPRRLGAALLACLLVAALGLLVLGRLPVGVAAVPLAIGFGLLPGVVHLLSEQRVRALVAAPSGRLVALAALGTTLAVGVALLAALVPRSTVVVVVYLVLVALVVALAAGSLADVAAVLAALALMGVVPASSDTPSVVAATDGTAMVALGDSYLSGEGATRYVAGTNEGGGNQCRRSATAWPVLVADRVDDLDRLVFRACSGAQSFNLREDRPDALAPAPRAQFPGEGQQVTTALEQLGGTTPAVVVVSIGGNDAGFAQIGVTCLALGDCDDAEPRGYFTGGNLDRVRNRLRQTYDDVRAAFPDSPVVAIPYPDPVAGSTGCASAPLSDGDVAFVTSFLDDLDRVVEEEATDHGFYYAGRMKSALAAQHLQLCNAMHNEPGLNFLDLRSVGGIGGQRFNPLNWKHNSLHPNERGHAAMAAAFLSWLADEGGLGALSPPADRSTDPTPGVAETTPREPADDCSAFPADDDEGCRARANGWALRETGTGLVPLLGVAGVGLLGTWLAAVSLLALRRRAGQPS